MMVQLTAAKIHGYGPWTLTLGYDREHRLQALQASLYAETQRLFSERDCLVFANRHDEYIIASNGIDYTEHQTIQELIKERFELELRMRIGYGPTPAAADHAMRDMQEAPHIDTDDIIILHMDVDDLTSRIQNTSPYDTSLLMQELHIMMSRYFARLESLSFFMGGDNFMVLASEAGVKGVRKFLDDIADNMGFGLNCGVGRASTGRRAAMMATKSLDMIRDIRDSGSGPKPDIYEAGC